jgi:hypothetical protein
VCGMSLVAFEPMASRQYECAWLIPLLGGVGRRSRAGCSGSGFGSVSTGFPGWSVDSLTESLILAQDERWRRA